MIVRQSTTAPMTRGTVLEWSILLDVDAGEAVGTWATTSSGTTGSGDGATSGTAATVAGLGTTTSGVGATSTIGTGTTGSTSAGVGTTTGGTTASGTVVGAAGSDSCTVLRPGQISANCPNLSN